MGLTVIISKSTSGVQARGSANQPSANQAKLGGVQGNGLVGSVLLSGRGASLLGVGTTSLPGTLSSSRSKSLSGVAATGQAGNASTGTAIVGWGFNISGMEWSSYAYTRGSDSNAPNRDFTVPRDEYISFIANRGFKKTRLPILWEMLQPVLKRQGAQGNILNAYGIANSGDLCPRTVRQITQVLDAHAAAGIKCYLDIHNYCRYVDFIYNADGSVPGFTVPGGVLMPYSATNSTQTRIFSSSATPSLTKADFNDLWTRIVNQWKGHTGLGGYMLMNEPHDLDANGTWPAYAQAAINTIRALDPTTPIYVGGNNYSNSTTVGTSNPGFPLTGTNLVYEAHMYLDASSSGAYFDYDLEVAKGFSVGEVGAINANTGFNRMKVATDWAAANGTKIACTELGLPLDDSRWNTMFKGATDLLWSKGFEMYAWMGGDHWPIHSYPINYVPGYYQGKSFEPKVGGVLKSSMGLSNYTLFDASSSFGNGAAGQVITVTLFCRGYVGTGFNITVTRTAGAGTLSTGTVAMPAGANPSATFTYTAAANEVATLTYSGPAQVPPARKIYNLTDPVAYAATSLTDAGNALLAKYSAAKWVAVDGAKDYLGANAGVAAVNGDYVRAIPDSGFASTKDNTFEMTNWIRLGLDYGTMVPPAKIVSGGLHKLDTVQSAGTGGGTNTWGSAMAQHVNPSLSSLNKVLATYWAAYDTSLALVNVPTYFNVVYIFHLQFSGPNPNTNNNGDGTLVFNDANNAPASAVQTVRGRGQKVILTVGGASNGYNLSNRQQSTNFVNSFIQIANAMGGVDGIDFNNFEANVGSSATELIWIVQQLRATYGAGFLVTAPPDANSETDRAMLTQMYNAGCLSWCAPQFYDWVGYDDLTLINTRLTAYRDGFGGNASAVMAGFPANNNLDAGPGLTHCQQAYDTFVGANPAFRGAMCWNAQINAGTSFAGTPTTVSSDVWGLWCKKQDIKETSSGELVQPNGKEVCLFDIHDPHFVVAAVEVTDGSADGAIFVTCKAEEGGYSELGLSSGGRPTAKFNDYHGNSVALQNATGLSAGAHVLSALSTGTNQILRIDKTQVTSGVRNLTASTVVGSNSHQIGWRFFNYYEQGTPGCNIFGVIAGKGNPTPTELTVIERFLGNTYAGLSL